MFELTANARNGPGTRVSAPRVDSRQISWWAEAADGTRDKELALVLTASGEYVVKEEEPGDFVILTMYTPSEAPKRRKPVEITLQAPGCEKMRIDEIADALFWTESAVEKFVYPYYAFQRLLTDEEMMRLKAEFRDERAVALWHQAPSRTVIVYGKGSGIEAPGLAVGSDQPPRGSATMDVPLLARHSTPRVDSRQISWWAESADGTRDKELALVLTASGEYVVKVEEPGDDVDACPRGDFRPRCRCLAARNLVGERERLLAVLEHIAGVAELREHDEIGSLRDRLIDHFERVANIAFLVADHRLHLDARQFRDSFLTSIGCHGAPPLHRWFH